MARSSSQIRIISGVFGGRLIDTPKTKATHPMGERERSAIFNRLRDEIYGRRVLDAFAGSGAIGLEAISLGAAHVDFMEKHPKAVKTIQKNLASLQVSDRACVLRVPDGDYSIIFADPPYNDPQYDLVASLIAHLVPGGYFVLSHPETPEPPQFPYLELLSDKQYASAHIKIYRKN